MKTYIVGFHRKTGSLGKRTINARNKDEAIIKCKSVVAQSFFHFILMEKQ